MRVRVFPASAKGPEGRMPGRGAVRGHWRPWGLEAVEQGGKAVLSLMSAEWVRRLFPGKHK